MALILAEGFDHEAYNSGGVGGNNMQQKGWMVNDTFAYVPGRFPYAPWSRGFEAAIIDAGTTKVLPGAYTSLICGFGVKIQSGSGVPFFNFGDCCQVGLDSLNRLTLYNDSGSIIATGTTQLNHEVWYYIEVKCDTSGHAEVHLNGFPEIPSTAGSFDTSIIYIQWLWQVLGAVTVSIDDVYVVDTTDGSGPTTFLGDVVVETFFPTSDGHYTQWTPKTGTDHFAMVDETTFDGEATYNYDNTVGHKDSYGIGSALAATTIYAVQVNLAARKQDSGTRGVKALVRQSATDYLSDEFGLSTDWSIFSWLLNKDPTGADWLYTTVNTDEYGVDVST